MDFLNKYFNFDDNNITYGLTNELICFYVLECFRRKKKNIIVLASTTYEANKIYNSLSSYEKNVYLFLMDDFLTSMALSSSPEFKMSRLEVLNKLKEEKKCIIITNLMGYLKFLPNKKVNNKLILNVNDCFPKNELIEKIEYLGYKRESIVTSTEEYASRGMLVDIFPINHEHPIRIEYFGNNIDKIKVFNEETQLSITEIDSIEITAVDEIETEINSSLYDYSNDGVVIYINNDQIKVSYEKLQEEIFGYNKVNELNKKYMFNLEEIIPNHELFIDNINNIDNFEIKEMTNFNENFNLLQEAYNKFIKNDKDVLFCLNNDKQKETLKKYIPNAKILLKNINKGFVFGNHVVICSNDIGREIKVKKNYKNNFKIGQRIKDYNELVKGDYVVHIDYGIGIYNGLKTLTKNGVLKDYIQIIYDKNDKVYIPVEKINLIYKYGDKNGVKPKLNALNSSSWLKTRNYVKSKAKDISQELLKLYQERLKVKKTPYKNYELEEIFKSQFEYELTSDQSKAISEIKKDLNSEYPMDRLLCGDVGFGKTEVANSAIIKTILNNKQVMYLCPTTILSNQQYQVIKNRFNNIPVNINLLNRFTSTKDTAIIKEKLEKGGIDIIIGTHRLLSDDIKFKDLGLLIIDEEQRFGVKHKEKIKKYKNDVNVLTLSATPIPRTLKMALSGLRDLSIIDTPPVNRFPVQTYVMPENDLIIKDAIYKEMSRNGQIYILYNRINNIYEIRDKINRLVPEARIGVAFGQMNKDELEDIMTDFINYEYDILLCTTIIENGIDIPNANTLLVMDADNFGLSQLYQIRGRVGRSNRIAYAYLFYNAKKELNELAIKRLQAIKEFTELGSGYKIAMRDLAIRGAGDIFGSDQAGFVDQVGITLYLKLVEDELKRSKGEYVEDEDNYNELPLNISTHIKDDYVNDEDVKIEIHQLINSIDSKKKLEEIKIELQDRFGTIDSDLEIYMYEELFSFSSKKMNIKDINISDRLVDIWLPEEISLNIKGDRLLIDILKLSTKFNIYFKNNRLNIKLYYKDLDKHYIYYLVNLLEIIESNIK